MATEGELISKSIELVSKATEKKIPLRLFGGLAVAYLAPNGRGVKELSRESNDIDLFSLSSHSSRLDQFMSDNGVEPDSKFNSLYGLYRRQYFYDGAKIDLILDEFRMCHRIQLKGRLGMSSITIPPSDLLLTKLQIFEMNEKDIKDSLALLHDLKMGNADTHTSIDAGYIAELLSKDWGIYRTVTMNLERINSYLDSSSIEQKRKKRIGNEIEYLRNAIELRSKSIGWKIRAKVGDKVRWYELPEEVDYVIPAPEQPVVTSVEENGRIYQWLGFPEMQELAVAMAGKIRTSYGKPKAILYIERGGMVLAQMLSDALGVKEMYGVQTVAYEGIGKMGQHMYILPHYINLDVGSKDFVLLVDDIADSGKTLKAVSDLFGKKYGKVVSATLAYKGRSVFKPDIIGKTVPDNAWIVFGYEENENEAGFRELGIPKGIELIENARKGRRGSFADLESKSKRLAESIKSQKRRPAAILYMTHTGIIVARLLSDYLSVKRVSSIIPKMYVEGDYMQHVVNVCRKAVEDNPGGYILLVDTTPEEISEVKKSLSDRMGDVTVMTAATESTKGSKTDFAP